MAFFRPDWIEDEEDENIGIFSHWLEDLEDDYDLDEFKDSGEKGADDNE